MIKKKDFLCGLYLIPTILFSAVSDASELKKSELVFSVKPFLSSYDIKYSFDSSGADSRYGNPTSVIDFQDLSYNGVSFLLDINKARSYQSFAFSIGSGSKHSGRMIDDDYYSSEFVGGDNPTRFSRTISEADVSRVYSFKFSSGSISHLDNPLITTLKYGMGVKAGYSEFSAYGLTIKEDPYDIYGNQDNKIYNNSIEVLKIKNYQLLSSFDFSAEKNIGKNISLSSDVSLIYLGYMLTKDYHLKRDDLGSPSFNTSSLMYGFDAGLTMSYELNPLVFSLSSSYSLIKPYSYRKTTEVFDSNQNSMGGIPTVSHNFKQVFYSVGVGYRF